MTIANPPHWKEPFNDKGPKYDKIEEMIAELNTPTVIMDHASEHETGGGDLLAHDSIPGGTTGNPHSGHVDTSGNETIAGIKTFSSIPVLPASDPTTDNQATRKAYIDDRDIALAMQFYAENGATIMGWFGGQITMPAADTNCQFGCAFILNNNWSKATATLYTQFLLTNTSAYAVRWWVSRAKSGEAVSWNVLDSSTAYDFGAGSANIIRVIGIGLSSLEAGDRISLQCASRLSNSPVLHVLNQWIE